MMVETPLGRYAALPCCSHRQHSLANRCGAPSESYLRVNVHVHVLCACAYLRVYVHRALCVHVHAPNCVQVCVCVCMCSSCVMHACDRMCSCVFVVVCTTQSNDVSSSLPQCESLSWMSFLQFRRVRSNTSLYNTYARVACRRTRHGGASSTSPACSAVQYAPAAIAQLQCILPYTRVLTRDEAMLVEDLDGAELRTLYLCVCARALTVCYACM